MSKNYTNIIPYILAGGSGTRLWPLSQESLPKPFVHLPSIMPENLLQNTIKHNDFYQNDCKVILNKKHVGLLLKQNPNIKFIAEPQQKDTLASGVMAALDAISQHEDAVVLLAPCDHWIHPNSDYQAAISRAYRAVNDADFITLGIAPQVTDNNYGYIEPGKETTINDCFKIKSFYEKPAFPLLQQLQESNSCFHNVGIYIFKAKKFLYFIENMYNDFYHYAVNAYNNSVRSTNGLFPSSQDYSKIHKENFERAFCQQTQNGLVVKCGFQWYDLGTWKGVWRCSKKDEKGNNYNNNAHYINSYNSYVQTKKFVIMIDMDEIAVIESEDAILITKLSNYIKKPEDFDQISDTEIRPWGSFSNILQDTAGFKIKKLIVKPGCRISLQYHESRSEHWIVIAGTAEARIGNNITRLKKEDYIFIPTGELHRIENIGSCDLVIIELQIGSKLVEHDIIRIEDDYKRTGT